MLSIFFVFLENNVITFELFYGFRWYKAKNASDKKKDKVKDSKRKVQMTPKQEEVLWRAFISHLQSNVCCL